MFFNGLMLSRLLSAVLGRANSAAQSLAVKSGPVRLITVATCVAVSACASGPSFKPVPEPPPGMSYIVLYRVPTLVAAAGSVTYFLDEKEVAQLRIKGYTYFPVAPGRHVLHFGIRSQASATGIEINAKAGERIYVRYGPAENYSTLYLPTPVVVQGKALTVKSVDEVPPELSDYIFQPPSASSVGG